MGKLLDSMWASLRDVFDPQKLGEMLAQGGVKILVALIVLAAF